MSANGNERRVPVDEPRTTLHRVPDEEGRKDDQAKPRVDLLPGDALLEVGRVFGYGAAKYGPDNWRYVPRGTERYLAATLRHLFAYMNPSTGPFDDESGLPHLHHAAASLLMLIGRTLQEHPRE